MAPGPGPPGGNFVQSAKGTRASLLLLCPSGCIVVFCCCDSPEGAVGVPRIQFQCTFHFFFISSMGQWTSRCPAAVSLFAFLGELYVSFLAGPRPPSLRCCVRWRFARVLPFFLFLLPVAIIYSFFVFQPRCGTVYVTSRVGVSCCCVFRQLAFLVFGKREYQKRGLSTIGTLYILCVSLVGTRAPFETAGIGLSCSGGGWARWQPGGA